MQVIVHDDAKYVFSFARGEELFQSLTTWVRHEGIRAATLSGLGAADELDLAYYHLPTKTYERHTLEEEVEILSLVGNVGVLNNEPALHIHGTFGRRDLSTFGGHLFKLRVSGACEVHLTKIEGVISRARDEATGLNLMCRV